MKTCSLLVSSFLVLAAPAAVHAAATTPVAGIFAGINTNGAPTSVAAGPTKLGVLNAYGPTVFELKNNTGATMKSLLVAVDLGAPTSGVRYACSTLTGQALPSCRSEMVGNTLYFVFSGGEILPEGTFRLGFASADDGTQWPSWRPVSVTPNGEIPSEGR